MINGALDYEKHSLANVSDIDTNGGLISRYHPIPTRQVIRPEHGVQGWWVFLKPLSPEDIQSFTMSVSHRLDS